MSAEGMGNSPSVFYSNLLNEDALTAWPEDVSHILSRMVPTKRVTTLVLIILEKRTKDQACPDIALTDILVSSKK